MNKTIELLAPVGSMESLYAAVQNGANAVYLGGKLFSARANASNFDYEELKEAISYAHLRNVKVYITVNILIDNSEMEEVIDYIRYLYEIDVDGIIVQDLGMAYLIREFFPMLDIHGSTQMTINNLSGAKFLENMGFTRVVLARETPLDEISYIKQNSNIELEAFVHGALCMSYSGQCLISSLIGGRSGNRGTCAQPCRMPYSIVDKNGELLQNWQNKYPLSTKDLNTLENLDQLIDSGIISLKIEGRLKRPEYVATVVRSYRNALNNKLSKYDQKDVEQIFNRGFTKGLTFGDFGRSFISEERPDNRGIYLGKVVRADKYKVYIKIEEDLQQGDGIEFMLSNGKYKGMKIPFDAKAGETIAIEKSGNVVIDSKVHKTSSDKLLKEAKLSYEKDDIKYPIDMEVIISIGKKPELRLKFKNHEVRVEGESNVEISQKVPITQEKLKEQLSKLGDTTYFLNELTIYLDENAFLPVRLINQLRRDAIDKLNELVAKFNGRDSINNSDYLKLKEQYFAFNKKASMKSHKLSIKVNTREQFEKVDLDRVDRIYLAFYDDLKCVVDKMKESKKEVYIWTDKILYQKDLKLLDKSLESIKDRIDGISVSNLGSLKYFKDKYNLPIHGDTGLNIFNSFTVKYLNSIGMNSMSLSPELNLKQIKDIASSTDIELEGIVYGYIPVMITRNCPMAMVKGCKDDSNCKKCNFARGYGLKDRMGIEFMMERKNGYSTIYNSYPIMVLDSLEQIMDNGITMARLDFTNDNEDISRLQRIYYDYINKSVDYDYVKEFVEEFKLENNITNGHYFRGII